MVFEKGDIARWVYGRITGHPMNFSFIGEEVAGSASPMQKKEVDWMKKRKGIGAILSIREDPLPTGWTSGLQYLNVPVGNHQSPTHEELIRCVNFISEQEKNGRKTVVHCAAGKGRTGVVLSAYLCFAKGFTAEDAIKKVRAIRPGSIEKKQEATIREYEKYLRKTGARKVP